MLTTGHALLILGFNVQLDTHPEAHGWRSAPPWPANDNPTSTSAARTRASSFRPPRPFFCSPSPSFLRPYSFASGQRTTFVPSALLASPSPTRIQLASLRHPSPYGAFLHRHLVRRRRADQTLPKVDTRTARVLPSDRGPSAAVTASGKSARGGRRDMLTESPCG
ncbi:hypothetical protein BKA80DRAFT_71176 [Phyllosticta citrichinensis]